ncbi:hypothetical protein LZ023_34190 [Pseudomonas silvicola]|nr:hypothetical protein LZ023_34190 [Pseudomonas silvicola]
MDPSDAGFPASGLSSRTNFDLGNHHKIPFDSDWFKQTPGIYAATPLPKMGVLHPSYFKAVKKANNACGVVIASVFAETFSYQGWPLPLAISP